MAALTAELQAKIEAYLLGRLPDEEQPQIEALLFEDDDMFEAIRDAEDDLIDRYLAAELPPADREAFEHAFATSTSDRSGSRSRALSRGRRFLRTQRHPRP
jgi:anti-sigma factor RsiW